MLVDRVLRRVGDGEPEAAAARLDHLDLPWDACHRRAQSATTRGGRPVRLLLRVGTTLRHGDVLVDSADLLLVVNVAPCEVWVARPTSAAQSALVALEWGNLHVPVQVCDDGALLTPNDGPALGVAAKHGVACDLEVRRFEPVPISGLTWKVAGAD